jgi:UDP-N-acetylmuramoyl-tripeptide--D-alanyl-D-alanine ligase
MGGMAGIVAAGALEGGLAEDVVIVATSHDAIVADLRRTTAAGDFILVKGSRGLAMDRVAEKMREVFTASIGKGAKA